MNRDLALIGLNAGMLAMLAGTLFVPLPLPEAKQQPLPQAVVSVAAPAAPPPRWPDVQAKPRPLFRPVPPVEAPALPLVRPPPPPLPVAAEPDLKLRGVLSDGQRWQALIEVGGEPERRLVRRGEQVGSWIVERIAPRWVTLRRESEQRELLLDPLS